MFFSRIYSILLLSSHQPFVLLFVEVLGPLASELQKVVGSVGLVVQVEARGGFLGHGSLDLRALVPLVEGGDGDDVRPHGQGRLQRRLVVASVHPVASVVVVPRPHGRVHVAGAHAGDEEQVVGVAERLDGPPVLVRRAEREAVGGEVGVDAVEAARLDVVLVALLHDQANEEAVVRCPPDAVGAFGRQELRPRLGGYQVGVIDVEKGQDSPGVGLEPVEGAVLSIPEKSAEE